MKLSETGIESARSRRSRALVWLCVLALMSFGTLEAAAQEESVKRVLIISTGSRFAPGFMLVDQQLLQALGQVTSARVETYAENLDIVQFPDERFQRIFRRYLTAKYAEHRPDLVILVYVGNLGIPGKLLPQLFPGTPIIVAGLTEEEFGPHQFSNLVTGIAQHVDPRATLELILRLQPQTRRVVVIGGTSRADHDVLARVKETAEPLTGRLSIEFWDNLRMAELRRAVAALPPKTAILFARMFRDAAGQSFVSAQVAQSIAQWAPVPVYVMADANLGTGAVGGSVASIEAFGKRAGELARIVLSGSRAALPPVEIRTESVPTFDWRALKRWGIAESRLPPGSVVRFKPQSVWRQYYWYIVAALVIIALQSAMIADLLVERARRRRIEAKLRDSRDLLELATDAGELGLWSRDLTTGAIWMNAPMRSLFGMGASDVLRFDDLVSRVHCDDRDRMMSEVERAQAAGLPFQAEFRVVPPNGSERWVLAKGRTVGEHSHDTRRLGVVLDITEHKRDEEELDKERAFLRQVIDIVPNFIFAKDREGRFTLANRAAAEAYGTTADDLIGKTDRDFNPNSEEVEFFRRMDVEVMDTLRERFIGEERITDARGKVRWLQTVKRPIVGGDGTASQVLGTSTDITQRKEAEMELRRQRGELAHVTRISIMGELAASLAHELNQPLTAILSNAQAALRFMAAKPPDLEEVREILKEIVEDNTRASEVIRRIRALVKKEESEFVAVDLNTVIDEMMILVHSDAVLHNVQITFAGNSEHARVRGDRVQLQQVLLNLLLNAFDAMKDCAAKDRQVIVGLERRSEDMKVTVCDRGAGLSGDMLEKIFQPFYTTRRDGLGMGLAICRSIIEAHGGCLWAENNDDRGAKFCFTVPLEEISREAEVGSG